MIARLSWVKGINCDISAAIHLYSLNLYLCSSSETTFNRQSMDRRRLEMAHLQYAVITVCSWYPQNLQVCQVGITPSKVDDMIAEFTKSYYLCFSAKYASEFRKSCEQKFNACSKR